MQRSQQRDWQSWQVDFHHSAPKEHATGVQFNPTGNYCIVSFYTGGFSVIDTEKPEAPELLFTNTYKNAIESV